jgi:hypothetical protein
MEEYDLLDIKLETQILFVEEKNRFEFILRDLKRFGSVRKQNLSKGIKKRIQYKGIETYFHAVANQRRREKFIQVLDGPNGPVIETKDMIQVAMDYYKSFIWS